MTSQPLFLAFDDSPDTLAADEGQASSCPPFEGILLIGHRWDPHTYHMRDLLVRNQVSYHWLDIDRSEVAHRLLAAHGQEAPSLPGLSLWTERRGVDPPCRLAGHTLRGRSALSPRDAHVGLHHSQ